MQPIWAISDVDHKITYMLKDHIASWVDKLSFWTDVTVLIFSKRSCQTNISRTRSDVNGESSRRRLPGLAHHIPVAEILPPNTERYSARAAGCQ